MALALAVAASSYFALLCGFADMVFALKPPCRNITSGEFFICHAAASISNPYNLMMVKSDQINGHIMGEPHRKDGWPDIYAGMLGINCTLFDCDCMQVSNQTCVQSNCIEPTPENMFYSCGCQNGTAGTFCEITDTQTPSTTLSVMPSPTLSATPSVMPSLTSSPTLSVSSSQTLSVMPRPSLTPNATNRPPDEPPIVIIILLVICCLACMFAIGMALLLYKKCTKLKEVDEMIAIERYLESSMISMRPLYYNKDGAIDV